MATRSSLLLLSGFAVEPYLSADRHQLSSVVNIKEIFSVAPSIDCYSLPGNSTGPRALPRITRSTVVLREEPCTISDRNTAITRNAVRGACDIDKPDGHLASAFPIPLLLARHESGRKVCSPKIIPVPKAWHIVAHCRPAGLAVVTLRTCWKPPLVAWLSKP